MMVQTRACMKISRKKMHQKHFLISYFYFFTIISFLPCPQPQPAAPRPNFLPKCSLQLPLGLYSSAPPPLTLTKDTFTFSSLLFFSSSAAPSPPAPFHFLPQTFRKKKAFLIASWPWLDPLPVGRPGGGRLEYMMLVSVIKGGGK